MDADASKSEGKHRDGTISRRGVLKALTIAGGAMATGTIAVAHAAESSAATVSASCQTTVSASAGGAVVETATGKVRGYVRNSIFTYKGIPYGTGSAGAGRFQPATAPRPWSATRDSMQLGPVCPQDVRTGWAIDRLAWLFDWNDGRPDEDCLRLNIWTPGINDNARRPVMVWFHGGGFQAGSGHELPSYDGENLSRRGDVVVVSVNHRLGILGHLNLAAIGGEKYKSSANVGILDLVLALQWVRDNIAGFGGDPSNVTIFGQSGGGGKVTALMAMPAAAGLFHKAIVQSGSILRMASPERTEALAAAVLAELGLTAAQLDQLHSLPAESLVKAAAAAVRKTSSPTRGAMDLKSFAERMGWAPTVDGNIIPRHPFDPDAPQISAGIPMMIGTTLNEFTTAAMTPGADSMTEQTLASRVAAMYADKSEAVIAAFRQATPNEKPFSLFSRISTAPVRQSAVWQAERKAAQGAAPAYLYWFAWQTPVLDATPGSFHCLELPFVFDNVERCANMTGGGAEARLLAARMSETWVRFARTGDPGHADLPKWEPFTSERCPTMIFDNSCELKINPDTEERKTLFAS